MAEFPGEQWKALHTALEQGSDQLVATILEELNVFRMSAESIVGAFEGGRSREVLAEAERILRVQRLLAWLKDLQQVERLQRAVISVEKVTAK